MSIGNHPLEGFRQEAILPPYTTLDHFFRLRSAWHTPPFDWSPQTHPCLPWRGVGRVGRRTNHPSGSRLRDVSPAGETSAPGTCCAPENRQFPPASNRGRLTGYGSLGGPVSLWLTVEASPDSPSRWEASCDGLRAARIKRLVLNHVSSPSPTPTQPPARPQPKALWTSKGTRSRMLSEHARASVWATALRATIRGLLACCRW
jgi:hypothetical protein